MQWHIVKLTEHEEVVLNRKSVGVMVAATVLALFFGAIQPFTIGLSMLVMVTPVVLCTLYFWAGTLPAIVCAVASMASLEVTYGAGLMWGGFVTMVVPAAAAIYLLRERKGYFTSMKLATGVQLAALLGVTLYLYLSRGASLVDLFIGQFREWLEAMNPALTDLLLARFSAVGLLDASLYETVEAGALLAAEVRSAALEDLLSKMDYSFKLTLPGLMMTSSLLTGVLMVALPTRICVRRGDEPDYSHVSLSGWFIPSRVTAGMLCALVTCLVLNMTGVSGGDAVYAAVSSVVYLIFSFQGLAAVDRMFKARGWPRGRRGVMLALLWLFIGNGMRMIGVASALFGRRGALTEWFKKHRDTHDKED